MPRLDYKISQTEECVRLDHFLNGQFPELSRSNLQHLIREGVITVNSKKRKTGYKLSIGDHVEGNWKEQKDIAVKGENIPIHIIFEDEYLIAINKAPGMVVHPAPGHPDKTLVNALLHHTENLSDGGHPSRPGVVHRLDKDTSGLLIIAKTQEIHNKLSEMFKNREISKFYQTLVWNKMKKPEGEFNHPIGRNPNDRKKQSVNGIQARHAITLYGQIDEFDIISLLKIQIITGRTHQIRVHLQHSQHPVIGDPIYGSDKMYLKNMPPLYKSYLLPVMKNISRQLLHSWKLVFTHPITGEAMEFEAPLPDDFTEILDNLKKFKEQYLL